MPFFSFSLNDNVVLLNKFNIKPNQTYYSKNTYIWKTLNKEKNNYIFKISREKRQKLVNIGSKILFFLPPSIGLGDSIEYALAIKAIKDNNIFKKIGVAFTDNYSFIFQNYFNLEEIYSHTMTQEQVNKYDSLFHVTLEIDALKNQKYFRSNIEQEIKKYFHIKDKVSCLKKKKINRRIKKISIFPISSSPIRTMPADFLNKLINFFKNFFLIEVYLDNNSNISNHLQKEIQSNEILIIDKKNVKSLVSSIKNIEYGIFMDSGPLHVAKMFKKRGILIESSVSSKVLLNNYKNIVPLINNFSSQYCKAPCGLTDVFNFQNKTGCYNSLKINQVDDFNNSLLQTITGRGVKNNYINFIEKPVGCLNSLNIQNILNYIKEDLSL